MITTVNLEFIVSGQKITADQSMPYLLASNTVNYVKVHFALGEDWQSVDTVSAVWSGLVGCYATVLDSDGNCFVPQELLARTHRVYVNLVGSDVDNDEVVDRITTYPVNVINVNATAYTCGSETVPLTPSQFEQYVAIVSDLVHSVKDIDRIELNEDYTLTVYFSDETSWTSTSIRGEQGETGNGIASAVLNDDYTLTLTFTDGTSYTTSSIRGAQGPQGEPGEVTIAQLESVLPTDTASGAIASFPDGSDLFDYLSCIVNIEPVQAGSGTPSPDNVRPITGWTGCEVDVVGKNLWNNNVEDYIRPSDYFVCPVQLEQGAYYTCSVKLKEGKTALTGYTIGLAKHGNKYADFGGIDVFANPSGYLPPYTRIVLITSAYDDPRLCVYTSPLNQEGFEEFFDHYEVQFEKGSTSTPYEPYAGTTYPVSWQTEAGTVYGGTVDVVTGVLTVDRAGVDLGAIDYAMFSSGFSRSRFRTTALETLIKKPPNNNTPVEAISSMFDLVNWGTGNSTDVVGVFGVDTDGDLSVWLNASDYSDATAFKMAMSGQKVVYKLAQTQTYQLTPTQVHALLGQNNVWADCGDVEVQYKADVQRWVEKRFP